MVSIDPEFSNALVFTGGGTGGHFFPAMALAEAARVRWPQLPIAFVGAQRGIEAEKLLASGWPHLLLDVEGFLGSSPLKVAGSTWKLWRAWRVLKARWKTHRPQAIIATGGYAAAPALFAARSLDIPYFLHESNAEPGRLIRLLALGADRVWCGLRAVEARLPNANCRVVGTPVREAFLRSFEAPEALRLPHRLLVLGGSGGARVLNEAVLSIAPGLLELFPNWVILHQAGIRDFEAMAARKLHPRHQLVPFIEAMDEAMEGASLALSRAGASTCAELKVSGRPAILVPFPESVGDHQRMNARAMEAEGQAVVVEQGQAFHERLLAEAARLMGSPIPRQAISRAEPNRAVELCLQDLARRIG
jgi:UDP-N-acetylglucosamine--N-acetylmuramyl-(pentapeptide) pyrophosphoryl-undecaprenol N-acetylglucosamine transferase